MAVPSDNIALLEHMARAICRPLCKGDFHPCDMDDGQTCKPGVCKHWKLYEDSAKIAIIPVVERVLGIVDRYAAVSDEIGSGPAFARCVEEIDALPLFTRQEAAE